jgi:THO complex subunit 1
MAGHVVEAVDAFGELLRELLRRAGEVKETNTVEPPLSKSDLEDILERVEMRFFSSAETLELRKQRHGAIDTAIRDKFNELLVSRYGTTLRTPLTIHRPLRRLTLHLLFKCGTSST